VSSLPAAEDPWAHEFYVNTFAADEIAYCVVQPDPLPHFAARWCAKEALRKCDPKYLQVPLVDVQVGHGENGAPLLQSARTREVLPYALSITHARDTAAAVVIHAPTAGCGVPAAPEAAVRVPAGAACAGGRLSHRVAACALGLALFAAVVACAALWRALAL
jgi:phosphopantetheinyl transferase (holo-ACP synthase)